MWFQGCDSSASYLEVPRTTLPSCIVANSSPALGRKPCFFLPFCLFACLTAAARAELELDTLSGWILSVVFSPLPLVPPHRKSRPRPPPLLSKRSTRAQPTLPGTTRRRKSRCVRYCQRRSAPNSSQLAPWTTLHLICSPDLRPAMEA